MGFCQAQNSDNVLYFWLQRNHNVQFLCKIDIDNHNYLKIDTVHKDTIIDHFNFYEFIYNDFLVSCDYVFDINNKIYLYFKKKDTVITNISFNNLTIDTCFFGCPFYYNQNKIFFKCYNLKTGNNSTIYLDLYEKKIRSICNKSYLNNDHFVSLSPNELYAFAYNLNTNEIMLLQKDTTIIIKDFFYELDNLDCNSNNFPHIWLNNETIITQKRNGEIWRINITGEQEYITTIQIKKKAAYIPIFIKDSNENIFYYFIYQKRTLFSCLKFKSLYYKIDIHNKTYTKDLPYENNFQVEINKKINIRYNNIVIGVFENFENYQIIDNSVIVSYIQGGVFFLAIWNNKSKEWHLIKFKDKIKIINY